MFFNFEESVSTTTPPLINVHVSSKNNSEFRVTHMNYNTAANQRDNISIDLSEVTQRSEDIIIPNYPYESVDIEDVQRAAFERNNAIYDQPSETMT